MIRPNPEVLKTLDQLSRNREFRDWVSAWRSYELERLPNIPADTVQLAQGRCQVLTEIYKLLHDTKNPTA